MWNEMFLSFLRTYDLIQCFTRILQNITSHEICVLSIGVNYQLNTPTIRFSGQVSSESNCNFDIAPNIYVADFTDNNYSLQWVQNIKNYNSSASLILIDANRTSFHENVEDRFHSSVIYLDSSIDDCSLEENSPGSSKFLNDVTRDPSILKVCVIWRVPYVICNPPNCTTDGYRGISVDLLDFVFELMNKTPVYIHYDIDHVDWVNLYPETILHNGSCDLVQRLIDKPVNDLGFIMPINDDYDIWIVPRAGRIPRWRYPMKVFSMGVWITMLLTTIITAAVWYGLDLSASIYKNEPNKRDNSFTRKFEAISYIFIEQPCEVQMLYNPQFALLLCLFLIISTFTTMYKSRLSALLLGAPLYEPPLRSFEDVLNKDMVLHFGDIRANFLGNAYPELKNYSQIREEKGVGWLDIVAFRKDTAALMSYFEVIYQFPLFLDDEDRNLLQPLPPPFIRCLSGFSYLRGNHIIEKIDGYVILMRDHGFIHRIIRKYEEKLDESEKTFGTVNKLDLKTFLAPTFSWLIGIALSCIVFLFEIWKKRK